MIFKDEYEVLKRVNSGGGASEGTKEGLERRHNGLDRGGDQTLAEVRPSTGWVDR